MMWQDVKTIAWKEFMEMTAAYRHDHKSKIYIGVALLLALLSALTIAAGAAWLNMAVIFWWMFSSVLVISTVADTFAGERERHTLETLLSTRLPDHTILFGKILPPVLMASGVVGVGILASLIPLNIAHGRAGLLLFTGQQLLMGGWGSVVVSLLLAEIGILISLHAPTVQSAQQRLGIGLLILTAVPVVVPGLALLIWGQTAVTFWQAIRDTFTPFQLQVTAVLFLLLLCLGLFRTTRKRFNRTRLILD